jgi:hypothetical protein
MKVILLVTWIVAAHASSYQVILDTLEKCNAARDDLRQDRERIVKLMGSVQVGPQFPAVSAICVYQ